MKFQIVKYMVFAFFVLGMIGCSENEVKVNPTVGLIKIKEGYAIGAEVKVEIWARENLFAGYNQLYFALYDSSSSDRITDAHIHLHASMSMTGGMKHGCPLENPEEEAVNELFPGALTLIMPSSDMGRWELEMEVHNHKNSREGTATFDLEVANPVSARIKSFVSSTGEKIFIAYHLPEGVKVGINPFEVIAYKMTGNYEFTPVSDYSFIVTPEMPAMGHGSPNNINPAFTDNGHYKGQVNFTMTGGWRLNMEVVKNNTSLQKLYFDVTLE